MTNPGHMFDLVKLSSHWTGSLIAELEEPITRGIAKLREQSQGQACLGFALISEFDYDGVLEQRSTLDVLIAEEVLRDAEIAEITAEHDEFLSESLLLRYIGRLDAGDIVASLPRYDPADNFRQVSNKGALPWESLIRAVDGIFLEGPNQREIPAPDAAERPTLAKWNGYPDDAARPASRVPVSPVPGTVGSVPFAYPDNGTDCQVPSSQTRPAQCPE